MKTRKLTLISLLTLFALILASACAGSGKNVKVAPPQEVRKAEAKVFTAVPVIPRDLLFGNPDKARVRISPDGTKIAFIASLDGVLNVYVAPIDAPKEAVVVTSDKGRGIWEYFWSYTNKHIVYLQDKDGDENSRIYAVDIASRETRELTPADKVKAQIQAVSHKFPKRSSSVSTTAIRRFTTSTASISSPERKNCFYRTTPSAVSSSTTIIAFAWR